MWLRCGLATLYFAMMAPPLLVVPPILLMAGVFALIGGIVPILICAATVGTLAFVFVMQADGLVRMIAGYSGTAWQDWLAGVIGLTIGLVANAFLISTGVRAHSPFPEYSFLAAGTCLAVNSVAVPLTLRLLRPQPMNRFSRCVLALRGGRAMRIAVHFAPTPPQSIAVSHFEVETESDRKSP